MMSSKGGVGKSTVAANLAIALKEGQGNRVALVDGDLHFGDAAILMNITPKVTVHDLIASLDVEIADRFLVKHPSGVEVLAAPLRTEQAEVMSPDRFRDLLGILQDVYDVIVVDASLSSLIPMRSGTCCAGSACSSPAAAVRSGANSAARFCVAIRHN